MKAAAARTHRLLLLSALTLLGRWSTLPLVRAGRVVINEISDKGTTDGTCLGEDWVELYHVPDSDTDVGAIELGGYVLHDDGGPNDEEAFTFPSDGDISVITPGQYVVLCTKGAEVRTSPQFGIGGDDTITLLTSTDGEVASTVGPLSDGGRIDVTHIRLPDGTRDYTTVPTPGGPNVHVPPDASEGESAEQETAEGRETADERRGRMADRNALGERFFGMGPGGLPVSDRFGDVVDLRIEMDDADFAYIMENPSHKVYRPFRGARVLSRSDSSELLSLPSPGRIRTKGAWSLIYTACRNMSSIPFSLDFDNVAKDQTLFGASRVYLRNKISDRSYMREWAQHRALARFGLPYLRTRKARFFVNGRLMGLYDLMEAPDQEYVFARSFPDYDPYNHALYKVKTRSVKCGRSSWWNEEKLEEAAKRVNDTSTPPYAWERGEHRKDIPVLGDDGCGDMFSGWSREEKEDMLVAYLRRGDGDCGKLVVEEGLMGRDLGQKSWDGVMAEFYNTHLGTNECSERGCPNSDLASDVDLTNFLKSIAFYAVTFNLDSPLGGGKNYYLAQSGDGAGWKIVLWDLDAALKESEPICDPDECGPRMVHWSILRPTCENVEMNQLFGPLLTRPALLRWYVEHVRELVTAVLTDESFIREVMDHANAIRGDVESDVLFKLSGRDYSEELSPDAAEWDSGDSPLLAMIAARTADVISQLEALDECSDSYRPIEDVDDDEKCADWRRNPPARSGSDTDTGTESARCDIDTPCSGGLCCSQYDYCGDTAEHCAEEEGCKSNCWARTRTRTRRRRAAECLLVDIADLPSADPTTDTPTAAPRTTTASPLGPAAAATRIPTPAPREPTASPQGTTTATRDPTPAPTPAPLEPTASPRAPSAATQIPTSVPRIPTEGPALGGGGRDSSAADPTAAPRDPPTASPRGGDGQTPTDAPTEGRSVEGATLGTAGGGRGTTPSSSPAGGMVVAVLLLVAVGLL